MLVTLHGLGRPGFRLMKKVRDRLRWMERRLGYTQTSEAARMHSFTVTSRPSQHTELFLSLNMVHIAFSEEKSVFVGVLPGEHGSGYICMLPATSISYLWPAGLRRCRIQETRPCTCCFRRNRLSCGMTRARISCSLKKKNRHKMSNTSDSLMHQPVPHETEEAEQIIRKFFFTWD